MLDTDEQARLVALLKRFDLERYQGQILAQGSPCISMALGDPSEDEKAPWPQLPCGVSKVGGLPDLPPTLRWPTHKGYRAGYFLQIALSELPELPWVPWPREGMLYLFSHDEEGATVCSPPNWELLYWSGPLQALKATRAPAAPTHHEIGFYLDSVARRIVFRAGTDFPPNSQSEWYDFIYPFEKFTRDQGDETALDRYFDFRDAAADPGRGADLAKGCGRFFYPLGKLFGHTDKSLRADLFLEAAGQPKLRKDWTYRKANAAQIDRNGADFRQVMVLESNPVTTYTSACDAAPVYVMDKDPGTRPWKPNGKVFGLASK